MSERLEKAIRAGLTVMEAAAISGTCRSTAYQVAASRGLVRALSLAPDTRRAVLRLIAAGNLSLLAIAGRLGISKTSVLRIRDQAARRGAREEGRDFRQTRSSYECPGCGARVRIYPCVACTARGATKCQHDES